MPNNKKRKKPKKITVPRTVYSTSTTGTSYSTNLVGTIVHGVLHETPSEESTSTCTTPYTRLKTFLERAIEASVYIFLIILLGRS